MFDETTGYGNQTYGGKGRSVGKKNTSKRAMMEYLKAFGSQTDVNALHSGELTDQEIHSRNRRLYTHLATHMKHLDKRAGAANPSAVRGLKRFIHHKNAPEPTRNVPQAEIPKPIPTITIDMPALQSESTQHDGNAVTLHKTAASRTKTSRAKFNPEEMLDDAKRFFEKEYNNEDPRKAISQEKRKIRLQFQGRFPQSTTWNDLMMRLRDSSLSTRATSKTYHALGVDMLAKEVMGTLSRAPSPERPEEKMAEEKSGEGTVTAAQFHSMLPPEIKIEPGLIPVRRPRSRRQDRARRRLSVVAEATSKAETEHTSYTHLIEGDMRTVGRIHLVSLAQDVGDERTNHFMTQMDADANMGANNLRHNSKRGPFKTSTGRSRVMDRSRHVAYRRRGHAMEITIRRGVTEYEMETLIGKLSAHRMGSQHADLYLISGSRKKMGDLDRINMEKLRDMLYKELQKRATIGLLIQDMITKGILHKGYSHSMTFKNENRKFFNSSVFAK